MLENFLVSLLISVIYFVLVMVFSIPKKFKSDLEEAGYIDCNLTIVFCILFLGTMNPIFGLFIAAIALVALIYLLIYYLVNLSANMLGK